MGMVRFGDKLDNTNWEILSKCCAVNGQVLKPARSIGLTNIDLHGNGERNTGFKGATGSIRWQTYSDVNLEGISNREKSIQNIILASNLTEDFVLPIGDLEKHDTDNIAAFQSYPEVTGCRSVTDKVNNFHQYGQ